MSEFMFGIAHKGDAKHNALVRASASKLDAIAQQHGADFVCASPPGTNLLGWFAGPNRGHPFDRDLARDVMADVHAAGLDWIWR